MSNETNEKLKDKKELLREKRELRMLERFMYDREISLRESTRKIKMQENYYTEFIKGNPKIIDSDDITQSKKSSKRGRKKKNEIIDPCIEMNNKLSYQDILHCDEKSNNHNENEDIRLNINNSSVYNNDSVSQSYQKTKNENNSVMSNSENNKISMNFKNSYLIKEYDCQIQNNDIKYDDNIKEKVENLFPNEIRKFKFQKDSFNEKSLNSKTFINCDLRFFNFDLITSRVGFFDVIMLDPPWRIKGGQRNDSSFMFSNSKFNLEYNTLSNNEIISLNVEKLSNKGFCFLWVLNSLLNVGYECLNNWGYDVVDQITWVKLRNDKLYISQGYYFLHSSETCLVGYKCPPNERVEYKSKIASNILFANVKGKSQKPDEIYELIEKMMPGSKKIELFARNNNLRDGWLSLGNQLGETYQAWRNIVTCDNCKNNISIGVKRYKSKIIPNYDICENCYNENFISDESILFNHNSKNFFQFKNNINEDILHQYYCCNNCNSEPIWGNRFQCTICDNYDLCEACFDKEISDSSSHVLAHEFKCFEISELANGLSTHNQLRCRFCFQKPIIGPCFECIDCKNYTICQNCYFNSSFVDDKHFNINSEHKFTIQIKTKNKLTKYVKCMGCNKEPIEKIRFKCNNCFDFNLCDVCYRDRMTKEFLATSHKNYHSFTAFYL